MYSPNGNGSPHSDQPLFHAARKPEGFLSRKRPSLCKDVKNSLNIGYFSGAYVQNECLYMAVEEKAIIMFY